MRFSCREIRHEKRLKGNPLEMCNWMRCMANDGGEGGKSLLHQDAEPEKCHPFVFPTILHVRVKGIVLQSLVVLNLFAKKCVFLVSRLFHSFFVRILTPPPSPPQILAFGFLAFAVRGRKGQKIWREVLCVRPWGKSVRGTGALD